MSILLSLVMLAVAVSIDSCGVGITYGLRQIRISITAIMILAACSGMVIFVAMLIGDYVSTFIPVEYANYIGAAILIAIGLWSFYQYYLSFDATKQDREETKCSEEFHETVVLHAVAPIWQLQLKRFGLVVQILKTPQTADVDRSGSISSAEAFMLGIALSLDAFGAGIGAAFLQIPILLTVVTIMLSSGAFIGLGLWLGKKLAKQAFIRFVGLLPGIMLIVIGVSKLL